VLKQVANILAPFISKLFKRSLTEGHLPADDEETGLDVSNVNSHRPISNLSILSKLLERLVARQLRQYYLSSALVKTSV